MVQVLGSVALLWPGLLAWSYMLHEPGTPFAPRTCRVGRAAWRTLGFTGTPRVQAAGRPWEDIVADVVRLAHRFHSPSIGARFAKVEGCRRAYDASLVEAFQALGLVDLLLVIAPGPELDRERDRVECVLGAHGVPLPSWL